MQCNTKLRLCERFERNIKIKNTTQNKQLQYGLLKFVCQIFKSTGIAKFKGNSVGFKLVASENLQVKLSPGGNHTDNFSVANNCNKEGAYFTKMAHLIPLNDPFKIIGPG